MIWKRRPGTRPDPKTAAMLEDALARGQQHLEAQRASAPAALQQMDATSGIRDAAAEMQAVELPFLWGWNHAYARAAGEWPSSPSMRASLQMVAYLMTHHGFDLAAARAAVSDLDRRWNEAEPSFEAIRRRGEASYADPATPHLAHAVAETLTR